MSYIILLLCQNHIHNRNRISKSKLATEINDIALFLCIYRSYCGKVFVIENFALYVYSYTNYCIFKVSHHINQIFYYTIFSVNIKYLNITYHH